MITMITGGHGAGKTAMALQIASQYPKKLYIATAEPIDSEMKEKIARHQSERDDTYTTLEVPLHLAKAIAESAYPVTIVDCVTVWLGNLMHYNIDDNSTPFDELCDNLSNAKGDIIIITNESSMSLIAPDAASRRYMRELAGLNKRIAAIADNVCLMVSGIAVWVKN